MTFFRRLKKILDYKSANKSYSSKLNYLRNQGARIGNKTRLNCSVDCFGSEPYLVTLGEDCLIAANVKFITHDGGVKVLNDLGYFDGKRMDIIAPINVGNNVYIGMGAYIMPGVCIGDNAVIGACSVVTHDIPANSVAVGVPARIIKTVDEYYKSTCEKGRLYETATLSANDKKEFLLNCFNNNNPEKL